MKVNVYLTFDGDCSAAFDFYKQVFGVEFTWRATMGESPMKDKVPADQQDAIMHVSLPIGENMDLMGCDYNGHMHKEPFVKGTNKQISLSPDSKEEADSLYEALSKGGSADQPLEKMFWGSYFGYLTDQFGIKWMVDCAVDQKAGLEKAVKEMHAIARRVDQAAENLEKLIPEGPPTKKTKQ